MRLANALIRLTPMCPQAVAAAPTGPPHMWIPAPQMNDAIEGTLNICGTCAARIRAPVGVAELDLAAGGVCPGGG